MDDTKYDQEYAIERKKMMAEFQKAHRCVNPKYTETRLDRECSLAMREANYERRKAELRGRWLLAGVIIGIIMGIGLGLGFSFFTWQ